MNSHQFRQQIDDDKSASFWLKKALVTAEGRDPLDALRDAEALVAFCKLHCAEAGLEA